MDDKANGVAHTVDDEDLNTTAPNPPVKWQMPEPVFRRTSGRLPQGFEKEFEKARAENSAKVAGDKPIEDPVKLDQSYNDLTAKHSTLKLVLVLLGVAAMIGFLVVFLTVVYFFFLR
jgi:hypothetical protein